MNGNVIVDTVMSKPGSSENTRKSPRIKNPAILMLGTAADTSWRMFVPIVGATIAGLWIDKTLHTTPWLMIVLMIAGIVLATLLVLRQVKNVNDAGND